MIFTHRNCQSQLIETVKRRMEGSNESEVDDRLNKLRKPGCFFINDVYECIHTDKYNIETLNTASKNTLIQIYDILKEQKKYKKIKEIFGKLQIGIDETRPEIKYMFDNGFLDLGVNFRKGLKHKVRGENYRKILKARSDYIFEAIEQDPTLIQKLMTYVGYKDTLHEKINKYVGLCYNHPEKTPSLIIAKNGTQVKCFGCGMSGDIIKTIANIKKLGTYDKGIQYTHQALQQVRKSTHPIHNGSAPE